MLRLSSSFSNEMMTMARQLATLAQEIRIGIVSFQLEGGEVVMYDQEALPGPTTSSDSWGRVS